MTSNRTGALVPAEVRPTYEPGDLAPLEEDVQIEQELDAEEARGNAQLKRLGMSDAEISKIRGRSPEDLGTPRSSVPTRAAIEKELEELALLRKTDRARYWSPEVQAREARLYELRAALSASQPAPAEVAAPGDGAAIPQAVLDEWEKSYHGVEGHKQHAWKTVKGMLDELHAEDRDSLLTSFDRDLPEAVRAEVYRFIGFDARGGWRPADDAAVKAFAETEEGAALVAEWGTQAAKNVGAIKGQVATILKSLSAADRTQAGAWLDGLSSAQAKAVWRALVPAT
jgi:hypothetical protein